MTPTENETNRKGTHPTVLRQLKKTTESLLEKLGPFAAAEMERLDKLVARAIETNRTYELTFQKEDEDFRVILNMIFHLESFIKKLPDKHSDAAKEALYQRCKTLARRKGYRV